MAGGAPVRRALDHPGKGARRRREIIEAAAEIIVAEGPGAVTHREVAARAACSLSATTYYFSGIEELLEAAGAHLLGRWAEQAERVRDDLRTSVPGTRRADVVGPVLTALLPHVGEVRGRYQQLLAAGASPALARAYRSGRARLEAAVTDILAAAGSTCPGPLAVAVVDGAVVSALSEGRDVRKTAADLLRRVV